MPRGTYEANGREKMPATITAAEQSRGAPAAVELDSVGLRYFTRSGETEALRNISFKVRRGEFVAIVGQSGCGKSTILSLIAGLMPPTSGAVLVNGGAVSGPARACGYMLQQDHLLEWRTILDNVTFGPEIQGADLSQAREYARELLVRYGLGGFMSHRPSQLSGGMRQRVALARTLCTSPDILLLDEPFSALDFQTRLKLSDEISAILRREAKTAILVTHDISEAVSMADRVIVLGRRPGHIKCEMPIVFSSGGGARPSPFEARKYPEFDRYFDELWRELEVHDEN